MSEKRSYRKRTAKEKAEIVLAGLRGDTSVGDVCREHESQAFIESWFRYLKERCIWRNEFETLDDARAAIAATSTATTTGPTRGSTTARRRR